MRLWSLHPKYLDAKGLVALWREALLAQKVLAGGTKGYRNHPQLDRFKQQHDPLAAIAAYLLEVQREAERRGYHFDRSKIAAHSDPEKISVSSGQLQYEFIHLQNKLRVRDAARHAQWVQQKSLQVHPLFVEVGGPVEAWEVVQARVA